jgi:hypothetical protein
VYFAIRETRLSVLPPLRNIVFMGMVRLLKHLPLAASALVGTRVESKRARGFMRASFHSRHRKPAMWDQVDRSLTTKLKPVSLGARLQGEPLNNLGAVSPALAILADPRGFAFSPNFITLSTVAPSPAAVRR